MEQKLQEWKPDARPLMAFFADENGYVYRDDRGWQTRKVLKSAAARKLVETSGLVDRSLPPKLRGAQVRAVMDSFPVVHGFDCRPDLDHVFIQHGKLWLNTYVPPTVVAEEHPHPRIERVLMWVTGEDPRGVVYIKNWLAAKLQMPHVRSMTALVFQSEQRTGKDLVATVAMEMLGRENCAKILQRDIERDFNGYVGKLLVVAGEVANNQKDLRHISNYLKAVITEDTVEMNLKHMQEMDVPNRMSWIFTSNDHVPVIVEGDNDGRYSVFANWAPKTEEYDALLWSCFVAKSKTFAPDFVAEIGGLRHELLNMEVDRRLAARPYRNEARNVLIQSGLSSAEAFVREVRERGFEEVAKDLSKLERHLGPRKPEDREKMYVPTSVFREVYYTYCAAHNLYASPSTKLGGELKRLGIKNDKAGTEPNRYNVYVPVPWTVEKEWDGPGRGPRDEPDDRRPKKKGKEKGAKSATPGWWLWTGWLAWSLLYGESWWWWTVHLARTLEARAGLLKETPPSDDPYFSRLWDARTEEEEDAQSPDAPDVEPEPEPKG